MELLFLTKDEIAKTTIVGGNVDREKYVFCIYTVQKSHIEVMLGTELYDKIVSDIQSDTLTGDYLELFNDFVKPITKNLSVAEYIDISNYTLGNKGLFLASSENSETASKNDRNFLSQKYKSNAQTYIERFNKWILKKNLTEYKTYQDEVNARKINTTFSWFFK